MKKGIEVKVEGVIYPDGQAVRLTLPDFQMVYQGGHHDVWCDGRTHIWTTGGWAGQWPVEFSRSGKCDCARWKDGGF